MLKMRPTTSHLMRLLFFAAIFSSAFSLACLGQRTYTITGNVIDSKGFPVKGALISIDHLPYSCKGCLDIVTEAALSDERGFFSLITKANPGQRLGYYVTAPEPTDYFPLTNFFEGSSLVPRELRVREFKAGKSNKVELGSLTPILNFRKTDFQFSLLVGRASNEFRSVKFGIATLGGIEIASPLEVPSQFWRNFDAVKLAMPVGRVILIVSLELPDGSSKIMHFRMNSDGILRSLSNSRNLSTQ